ncbi:hypothetical protein CMU59_01500 [Elizabethkingia anophelis]|uniref:hypothetical protein n=1 Tax=Elizabethkingia anophelis TaxID=1117645 RepID=UPI0020126135|nr:hypothetical protein [Elizabethkingia anophelis]MCL1691851.1 hypothetical protein [Elizabethkingia anophelis]MDV3573532.1 hypothetical protein [Elizabethkingia anophelis]MDV3598962.1 hypothetical protein [Elizabethkingia anophelis]MDV3608186.1 hypothetical protein [Elizabethkingia anophelis]MDV3637332.1 hypothetical protein [Elizabethkingia anophelis]
MSEDIQNKRILVLNVFEKVKSETSNRSKNSIAEYINVHFQQEFGYSRNEKTYVRYYDNLVIKDKDYPIDELSLLHMSKYLSFNNYEDFCERMRPERNDENKYRKIIIITIDGQQITIIINPDPSTKSFNLSDFFAKQSHMGILGIILIIGTLVGSLGSLQHKSKQLEGSSLINLIMNGTTDNPEATRCMYWNDSTYTATACDDKTLYRNIVPIDSLDLKNFKKITKPDTLTPENALGKIWYSKRWNKVEFFSTTNRKGTNPKNGATLRPVTEKIIEKHAHKK